MVFTFAGIMLHMDPGRLSLESPDLTGYFWGQEQDQFPKIRAKYRTCNEWINDVHEECYRLLVLILNRPEMKHMKKDQAPKSKRSRHSEIDWLTRTGPGDGTGDPVRDKYNR